MKRHPPRMARTAARPRERVERAPRGRTLPIMGWRRRCGWCAKEGEVRSDGRNLLCPHCGRW